MHTCHIVAAAEFAAERFAPEEGDLIIACDGGLAHLSALKRTPDLIVGDFDSFDGTLPHGVPVIRLPVEKDDTDTLYALRFGLKEGYTRFALHGCLGGKRLSHTLANIQLLTYLDKNGATGTIYGKNTTVYYLKNGKLSFSTAETGFLSVLALSSYARARLTGLKYPFDGILSSDMPLGVSNAFIGEPATVELLKGSAAIIIEEEI